MAPKPVNERKVMECLSFYRKCKVTWLRGDQLLQLSSKRTKGVKARRVQANRSEAPMPAMESSQAGNTDLYNSPIPMLPFLPLFPCDRLRDALRSTLVPFYSGSLPVSFILTHQELDSCGFRLPATGIRSQLWICLRPGFHLFLPVTCNCGNTRTTWQLPLCRLTNSKWLHSHS